MNNIMKLNLLSGVVALGLLSVPVGAQAAIISLASTTDGITLTVTGTLVDVSIAAGTGSGSFLNGTIPGTYSLGAVSLTAGPNVAERYPVTVQSPASEAFTYSDSAGNALTGDIHWNFLQDNTHNPKFFGSMTVLTSSGSAGFMATWSLSSIDAIDFTTTGIGGGFAPWTRWSRHTGLQRSEYLPGRLLRFQGQS